MDKLNWREVWEGPPPSAMIAQALDDATERRRQRLTEDPDPDYLAETAEPYDWVDPRCH